MKFAFVILSVLCLIGVFMPMATAGELFVNVTHVGGIAYLLYVLPLIALILSVIFIYKPEVPHMKVWFVSLGLIGILLTGISIYAGCNQLKAFRNMQLNSLEMQLSKIINPEAKQPEMPNPSVGFGGIMVILGNLGLAIAPFIVMPKSAKRCQEQGPLQ